MKRRALVATVVLGTFMVATPVLAQRGSGDGQGRPGNPAGLVCSTTDYTALVAKTLDMTATELRVALTKGQTIQDLATIKNVSLDTIQQAVETARKVDLDQAVKDGLLTQAEADAILQRQQNAPNPPQPNGGTQGQATQPAPDGASAQQPPMHDGRGGHGGFGFGISPTNRVDTVQVIADALEMSCADLVKAVQGGKTIAQVAADHNVQLQTLVDKVVAAHKDALAKDVAEGLITQAEADGRSADLTNRITTMLQDGHGFDLGGMRPDGGKGGFPGGPHGDQNNGSPDGSQPKPGQGNNNPVGTPPATQSS